MQKFIAYLVPLVTFMIVAYVWINALKNRRFYFFGIVLLDYNKNRYLFIAGLLLKTVILFYVSIFRSHPLHFPPLDIFKG